MVANLPLSQAVKAPDFDSGIGGSNPPEAATDLCMAPGAADFTFGSVLSWMVGNSFQRVETLDPEAAHRFYVRCLLCDGDDMTRTHYKPSLDAVVHSADCGVAKHLPRLRAMANKDVT